MKHQRAILLPASVFFFLIAAVFPIRAQQDPKSQIEPSYEAVLQVVVGSDQPSTTDLPQSLAPTVKQLRSTFGFTGFRLANTYIGRFTAGGSIEYKSLSDIFGQPTPESSAPTFLEWNMGRLRPAQDDHGQTVFQAESFRFGVRVPVLVGQPTSGAVNYEGVGVNFSRFNFPLGKPTLVGTLSLPKATGTLFLVLTARQAEY